MRMKTSTFRSTLDTEREEEEEGTTAMMKTEGEAVDSSQKTLSRKLRMGMTNQRNRGTSQLGNKKAHKLAATLARKLLTAQMTRRCHHYSSGNPSCYPDSNRFSSGTPRPTDGLSLTRRTRACSSTLKHPLHMSVAIRNHREPHNVTVTPRTGPRLQGRWKKEPLDIYLEELAPGLEEAEQEQEQA